MSGHWDSAGQWDCGESPPESRLWKYLSSKRPGGSPFAVSEVAFLRYFQEGGVTDVVGSPAEFDFEFTPRFEFGYVGAGGLGARGRYWFFDETAPSAAGDSVSIDTFCIDAEVFQQWAPTCKTELEIAAGLRYVDFEQVATNVGANSFVLGSFDGLGGMLAVEGKRKCRFGSFYARGRLSMLTGDASVENWTGGALVASFLAAGHTTAQLELGLGFEVERRLGDRVVATARFGYQWQQWSNLAVADTSFGGIGNDDVLEDAGFSGLVVGLGLSI